MKLTTALVLASLVLTPAAALADGPRDGQPGARAQVPHQGKHGKKHHKHHHKHHRHHKGGKGGKHGA